MIYLKPVDYKHLCLRETLRLFGRLPVKIPDSKAQ
jgi:hypothetical protein